MNCLKQISYIFLALIIAANLYADPMTTTTVPTADQSAKEIPAMDKSNMTDQQILDWAKKAILSAYDYDYLHHDDQLEKTSTYFTPAGWKDFTLALENANIMKTVINEKMQVSADATDKPSISKQGAVNGIYVWHIQMPIIVTYHNDKENLKQHLLIKILAIRTAPFATPDGVGIQQFVSQVTKPHKAN